MDIDKIMLDWICIWSIGLLNGLSIWGFYNYIKNSSWYQVRQNKEGFKQKFG